eukprot:scaffold18.g1891.t1
MAKARQAYAAVKAAGGRLKYNSYQQLISAAAKGGDATLALEAFREAQAAGMAVNKVTYCCLISACGRQRGRGVRYAQVAYELWQELLASGMQLDAAAYRAGMKACVDVRRLPEAAALLEAMRAAGEAPDVRAYNILLKGHSRAADAPALAGALRAMGAAGVRPSAVTYNTLIDGYVRAGALAEAQACAAQARAAGLGLDAWAYSSLLRGHVQAGDLVAAGALLAAMRAAGVRPNCVTYSTLIDGHARAGRLGEARALLDEMAAAGERPSAVTYNSLLRGLARGGGGGGDGAASASGTGAGGATPDGLRAALELLGEMQAAGVAPSTDTFNTLMAAALEAGEPRLAVALHVRLARAGLRPDGCTYTVLIQAQARLGRPLQALALFEALQGDAGAQLDLPAYCALTDALARVGDMAAAERLLKLACAFAQQQGKPPPLEAFGAVVTGYARQMAVHRALGAVRQFLALGGTPDGQMLDILFDVALRAGEYKVAMQAVRAMELVGQAVDKAKYRALMEARLPQGAAAASEKAGHNRTWADYQRRREKRQRNVHLQRLLFWAGISTAYYDDTDSDSE